MRNCTAGKRFIESIFRQLKEGKTELTFGFSDSVAKSNPEELRNAFNQLNPV